LKPDEPSINDRKKLKKKEKSFRIKAWEGWKLGEQDGTTNRNEDKEFKGGNHLEAKKRLHRRPNAFAFYYGFTGSAQKSMCIKKMNVK